MNINPTTFLQKREAFLKTLLNNTDKVSKIADHSVLSGIASGLSKTALLAEKDIAIYMSQLLPDDSYGLVLDACAENFGVSERKTSSSSSVYVRLVGSIGTSYIRDSHFMKSNSGITFQLDENITIPSMGFVYMKAKSLQEGSSTNVDSLTINDFINSPSGHIAVINEASATGGVDIETDDSLRRRIKNISNVAQTGTLALLEQIIIRTNANVFKIYYNGINAIGNISIGIVTENGATLTDSQINILEQVLIPYLSLTDRRTKVEITNVEFYPIDISFRVELDRSIDIDATRREIQYNLSSYLDFRYFDHKKKVEQDNMLEIVKSSKGVKYVLDQYFSPKVDITIPYNKLPRLRGFLMLDLRGNIISNLQGTLSPIFYPNQTDFNLQRLI